MTDRKVFRNLLEVDKARAIFEKHAPLDILGSEKVSLINSLNRVSARTIFSPIDVPPFDRASMDGFAIHATDSMNSSETEGVTLKVVGEIKAGYVFDNVVGPRECVEISTGASMPVGPDSVIMVEYTHRKGDYVDLYRPVSPGENVMSAGTDIKFGERIIAEGTLLTSRELAVLAAMGISEIDVVKKPKVALFSSGDEIIPIGSKLVPGKLFDTNSTALAGGIIENGGDVHFLGIILDKLEELEKSLRDVLNEYDLIIISGGTSAGMGDMLYTVVDLLGSPGLLVHGIKVKPGKPTILAVCNGTPIIGLPGYPASALSIFKLFVIPYLRKRAGLKEVNENIEIDAIIKQRLRSVMGRHEFKPMNLINSQNGWIAFPVPGGSGAITSIALADGFIEIPDDVSFLPKGEKVKISLFSSNIIPADLQIIGSHCILLSKLQKLYSTVYPQYRSRAISVGSSGGVSAIRRGEAHLAGVHMLFPNKGYNKWLEDELDAIIIPGYYRMQGLVIKKENLKNINSIQDLTRKDIRFMNRNPGSGTRILFDHLLEVNQINKDQINGYNQTVKSHRSVALAISMGLVDVGVAIENVVSEDLKFIPLQEEEYDFLVRNEYIELPAVQDFIKVIRSEDFQTIISNEVGYRVK